MTEPSTEEISATLPEPPPRPRGREAALALAAALAVLIAGVATAPFWAPPLGAVLPWGKPPGPDPELLGRIARLDAAQRQQAQAAAQQAASLEQLGQHVAQLEAKQGEPQQAAAKALSAVQQIEPRIAALEAAQQQERQGADTAAAGLKQLDSRVAALESRPEASPKDLGDLRQQLEKLSSTETSLAPRIDALEKARAQSQAAPADAAILLALLQIGEAVQTARPFPAEYDALVALARGRPEIAEAAAPLAEPAKAGVASHMALARRLHELAASIADAQQAPAAGTDWGGAALARLRGLVTIRRVGDAGKGGAEAAVSGAEAALAGGDLSGAVAALDKLTGPAAERAAPWLRTAHQRLAVETALRRIETLLTADLGKPATPAAPRG